MQLEKINLILTIFKQIALTVALYRNWRDGIYVFRLSV